MSFMLLQNRCRLFSEPAEELEVAALALEVVLAVVEVLVLAELPLVESDAGLRLDGGESGGSFTSFMSMS